MDKVKKIRRVFIVIMIAVAIIVGLIAIATDNIRNKVNKIQFNSDLDKSQLAINEDLYNEVANSVTQEEFNSIQNIAILGIDEGRCDLIMIASINQSYNKIKLITIPRDTYVNVDEYDEISINQAYLKTINSNFGLNITKYISIDYKGIMKFINRIGGITFNITTPEMNYINENIHLIAGENATMLNESGRVHLTGEQVLAFMRNTNVTENGEIENRQKRVLMGILDKLYEKSFKEIWNSIDYILEEVQTNLNKSEDMGLGREIMNNAQSYIEKVELTQATSEDIIKNIIYEKD